MLTDPSRTPRTTPTQPTDASKAEETTFAKFESVNVNELEVSVGKLHSNPGM
jgi:hypothetical protein